MRNVLLLVAATSLVMAALIAACPLDTNMDDIDRAMTVDGNPFAIYTKAYNRLKASNTNVAKLTRGEFMAIRLYTEQHYFVWNALLRKPTSSYSNNPYVKKKGEIKGKAICHYECKATTTMIEAFDYIACARSALDKLTSGSHTFSATAAFKRNVMSLPESIASGLNPGSLFSDPAFLSTTKSKVVNVNGASSPDFVFQVKPLLANSRGFDISPMSAHKEELEVLFGEYTFFCVVSRETKRRARGSSSYTFIVMQEMASNIADHSACCASNFQADKCCVTGATDCAVSEVVDITAPDDAQLDPKELPEGGDADPSGAFMFRSLRENARGKRQD